MTPGLYDDVHAALFAAGVRYVVVGGTAVVLQGHARMTIDLHLVVDLAPQQALAAVHALQSIGLRPRLPVAAEHFADADIRREWVEQRNLRVFSFYDPSSPLRDVDLFAEAPLPFEELYSAAVAMEIAGAAVRVASKGHLITMKTAAGRPVDLQDGAASRRSRHCMSDPWEEATFEGHRRAQLLRAAAASPADRLAAAEQLVRDAYRAGVLQLWRERKQRAVVAAWERSHRT